MSRLRRPALVELWPFGLAALPVFDLFRINQDLLPEHYLIRPILVLELITLVVWLLVRWGQKTAAKVGLITAAFLADLLFYVSIQNRLGQMGSLGRWLSSPHVFAVLLTLVTIGFTLLVWRSRKSFQRPAEVALIITGALVAYNLVSMAHYRLINWPVDHLAFSSPLAQAKAAPNAARPDIYYVILDRYASNQTLASVYGYDNSAFTIRLGQRGFSLGDNHANYPFTAPSLSSSLNGDYLPEVGPGLQSKSSSRLLFDRMIKTNGLAIFFKKQGYQYTNIGSWWESTRANPGADRSLRLVRGLTLFGQTVQTNEFDSWLVQQTILSPILSRRVAHGNKLWFGSEVDFDRTHRDSAVFEFEQLNKLSDQSGPKFVFAHILMPHPPFVFAADGGPTTGREPLSDHQRYLAQLEFTNRQVNQWLDSLKSKTPAPVIVIQADEGPYPPRFNDQPASFDWRRASPAELQEKTGILNALSLPGKPPPPSPLTPVNTWRYILNQYFDTKLPFLPDRHYINNQKTPYQLIDLTDRLKP